MRNATTSFLVSVILHAIAILLTFVLSFVVVDRSSEEIMIQLAIVDETAAVTMLLLDPVIANADDVSAGGSPAPRNFIELTMADLDEPKSERGTIAVSAEASESRGISGQYGSAAGMGVRGDKFVYLIDKSGVDANWWGYNWKCRKKGVKPSRRTFGRKQHFFPNELDCPTDYEASLFMAFRSIESLDPTQQFAINAFELGKQHFMLNEESLRYFPATTDNIQKAKTWIRSLGKPIGDDMAPAIRSAAEMQPDAIFLFSTAIRITTHTGLFILQDHNRRFDPNELDEAIHFCREQGVRLFPIIFESYVERLRSTRNPDRQQLERWAKSTGGSCQIIGADFEF